MYCPSTLRLREDEYYDRLFVLRIQEKWRMSNFLCVSIKQLVHDFIAEVICQQSFLCCSEIIRTCSGARQGSWNLSHSICRSSRRYGGRSTLEAFEIHFIYRELNQAADNQAKCGSSRDFHHPFVSHEEANNTSISSINSKYWNVCCEWLVSSFNNDLGSARRTICNSGV